MKEGDDGEMLHLYSVFSRLGLVVRQLERGLPSGLGIIVALSYTSFYTSLYTSFYMLLLTFDRVSKRKGSGNER